VHFRCSERGVLFGYSKVNWKTGWHSCFLLTWVRWTCHKRWTCLPD